MSVYVLNPTFPSLCSATLYDLLSFPSAFAHLVIIICLNYIFKFCNIWRT